MAPKAKKRERRTWPRRAAKYLGALLAALLAWMLIEASIVRLEFIDVPVPDLPAGFDGVKVLFLSDLHVSTLNPPEKLIRLMRRLMESEPDLLLLGGDYTCFDVASKLTAGSAEAAYQREADLRDEFFTLLSEFTFPLGKYGVAGECDRVLEARSGRALAEAMSLGGVALLNDESDSIYRGLERVVLIGLDDWKTGAQNVKKAAALATGAACTIVLAHNPDCVFSAINQPASDGGRWIDLMLTGHTHGGQFNLFGKLPLKTPSIYGERFLRGWRRENNAWMLVSGGIANEFVPVRFFSPPQAHLITLRASE